jgi:hypothetical protein
MKALEAAADTALALEALLDELHEPAVRDLAWLLFSAPLVRAQPPVGKLASVFETPAEAAATFDWLLDLDRDCVALHSQMAEHKVTRLGRYGEYLLAFYLRHGPGVRLVAANVALRRAGRTLGECDFLVETATGRRLHWELAVKCYLHAGGARTMLADYVGPNLQDRFDLKLAHLLNHQLPLSARDEFASLGHVGPWEAQMFVKGWLFYRWSSGEGANAVLREPGDIEPAHSRGFWITRGQWREFTADGADGWAVLPRLSWLAPRQPMPVDGPQAGALCSARTLEALLGQESGPTMVAAFACDRGDAYWHERARGFIVPDDWPERAGAFALAS